MLINYDNKPSDSVYYLASVIFKHIKLYGFDPDECYSFFLEHANRNALLYYYSLDFLYLIGAVRIDEKGDLLCA